MRKWQVVAMSGLLIVGSACTSDDSSDQGAATAPTDPTAYKSTSADWQDVGDDISADDPTGFGPYQSQPIDIEDNGTYALVFGPLTDEDAAAGHITGLSLPSDVEAKFEVSFSPADAEVVEDEGSTYLSVPLTVANFQAAYVGLTAWAQ